MKPGLVLFVIFALSVAVVGNVAGGSRSVPSYVPPQDFK